MHVYVRDKQHDIGKLLESAGIIFTFSSDGLGRKLCLINSIPPIPLDGQLALDDTGILYTKSKLCEKYGVDYGPRAPHLSPTITDPPPPIYTQPRIGKERE